MSILSTKDRELNNLHIFVEWASRPFFLDGRDAHPTRTIKIVSYLILIPNQDLKPLELFFLSCGLDFDLLTSPKAS